MAYWFYYTADGQKQGAVSEEKLKELAANGKITPGTMLEHQSGDTTVAKDVKWLTFGEAIDLQKSAPPPPVVTQPVPDENAKKVTKSIGEQMQDVGQGVQAIGKGACSCGCLVAILFVIFAAIFGTPSEEREQRKEEREQRRIEQKEQQDQRKAQQEQQKTERQSTPKMPLYSIVKDEELRNIKRSVEVRLEERITEAELTIIANEIKSKKRTSYERTFIEYFMPGMISGQGCWATTHFNPDLVVRILGASKELLEQVIESEEQAKQAGDNIEIIGRWDPLNRSVVTIKLQNEESIVSRQFPDGSGRDYPLVRISNGRDFAWSAPEMFGNNMIGIRISPTGGHLILFGNDGDIDTWYKIKQQTQIEQSAQQTLENGIRDISRALPTIPQAQLAASAKKIAQQESDVSKVLYKLRNIGNLAVATKTDLATTHRIVDNVMETFGHGIADTQKVVDSLATATVRGNMTLKELGEAYVEFGKTSE